MDRDAVEVTRLKNGDYEALKILISRHRNSLQYMIYRMVNNLEDAEDLTMETFEEAYLKIHKYRPTYKFTTWLFSIGKNKTIDFMRRKKIIPSGPPPLLSICCPDPTPEQALIYKQGLSEIDVIFSRLKKKDQRILEMRCDGHRYEDIGKTIGINPITARVRFIRAKDKIINHLSAIK